eukprot:scaffold130313_cov81-Phaeocystis_antarctica.AAC.1
MAWPRLVSWLRIFLIRAGSSESGAPSPLAAAGTLAVACIAFFASGGARAEPRSHNSPTEDDERCSSCRLQGVDCSAEK